MAFKEIAAAKEQQPAAHEEKGPVEQGPEGVEVAGQEGHGEKDEGNVDKKPVLNGKPGDDEPEHPGQKQDIKGQGRDTGKTAGPEEISHDEQDGGRNQSLPPNQVSRTLPMQGTLPVPESKPGHQGQGQPHPDEPAGRKRLHRIPGSRPEPAPVQVGKGEGEKTGQHGQHPVTLGQLGKRRTFLMGGHEHAAKEKGQIEQEIELHDIKLSGQGMVRIVDKGAKAPVEKGKPHHMLGALPCLAVNKGQKGKPDRQEPPVNLPVEIKGLHAGPQGGQNHGRNQSRLRPENIGGKEAAQAPEQNPVGIVTVDVIDLGDEHDVGAEENHAQEQQGLADAGRALVGQQASCRSKGAPHGTEQKRELGKPRHMLPVGGKIGNDAGTEQQYPEDAEGIGEEPAPLPLPGGMGQNIALAAGIHPTLFHPERQLFLQPLDKPAVSQWFPPAFLCEDDHGL